MLFHIVLCNLGFLFFYAFTFRSTPLKIVLLAAAQTTITINFTLDELSELDKTHYTYYCRFNFCSGISSYKHFTKLKSKQADNLFFAVV